MTEYSPEIEKELEKQGISVGHRIAVERGDRRYEGVLMPNTGDPTHMVVKLDNGYNIGIAWPARIKKLKGEERRVPQKKEKHRADPGKKTITIIHTGGTVASKIDYETGGVRPQTTPEELAESIPELFGIVNVNVVKLFQILSEDAEPEHWIDMTKAVEKEVRKGVAGIIITHGTETMHYTSAALSFMLQNLPVPVLLVGSQRSSDRGSSDAAMNVVCAANFIAKASFRGVAICMHGSMSDDFCYIHSGVHVRKSHTSRRDAFQSIDVKPLAKVYRDGEVEWIDKSVVSQRAGKFSAVPVFDKHVGIIKMHPGFNYKEFEGYVKAGYRGVVIEGTGLGDLPVSVVDKYTQHHTKFLEAIRSAVKKGVVVAVVSQAPYGKVNLNVYSTGRKLIDAGVTPARMLSEVAFVKLGWLLAQMKDPEEIRKAMQRNLAGEVLERLKPEDVYYES